MSKTVWARLSTTSPRYPEWLRIFRGDTVQIESPTPLRADITGRGSMLVYQLKLSALSAEARDRLASAMAMNFSLPITEVVIAMNGEHGCPIFAEDVTVSFQEGR